MDEIIVEKDEVQAQEPEQFTAESLKEQGMSDAEIEMARGQGIIGEDKPKEEDKESEGRNHPIFTDAIGKYSPKIPEQSPKPEEKEKEEPEAKEPDTFEEIDETYNKDPQKFHDFSPNSKALYFKMKKERQKRQELEARVKEIDKTKEFEAVREKGAKAQLEKVRALLNDPEKLTIEDLQEALGEAKKQEEYVTRAELMAEQEKKAQSDRHIQFIQSRIAEAEKFGRASVKDFDEIVKVAQEVISKKPFYQSVFQNALVNPDVDEAQIVEIVKDIAKLSDKVGTNQKPKEETNAERAIKNASKAKSSASVSGGAGRRAVSYDDLTAEDVLKMDLDEYKKIPQNVIKKILTT